MNLPIHFINTVLHDKDSRFTIRETFVGDPETYDVRMTFLLCLLKHHNHAVRPADQHLSNALYAEVLGSGEVCHLQLRQLRKEGDQLLPPPERTRHHHLHDAS